MRLLLALAFALPAEAAYPERAITIIVPLPPGGPADAVARVVGQKLSERLGQPVTIDNKPGALGLIGAEIGAHAKPDGYTIVMVSSGLAIQVATQPKTVKFDVHKDLQPRHLCGEGADGLRRQSIGAVQDDEGVRRLREDQAGYVSGWRQSRVSAAPRT